MRQVFYASAATAALLFASSTGALAQTTPAPDAEVVIVTAQKREENVQRVASAVSVVSSAAIANTNALNIEGITALVPSLNFRKGGTSINSTLFLRGVGTSNFSLAAEPSVSTVLDGVVLARAGEAFGDLVDIERLEVLRGPNGTLFGKNASAGVVSIISKRPGRVLKAEAELSGFQGNEYKGKLAIDVPFSETARARITAFAGEYDGNITNLTTGNKINGYNRQGVRGIFVFEPSDKLDVTIIGDYRKADDVCCGEVLGAIPAGANQLALQSLLSGINFSGNETRQVRNNLETRNQETAWGLSGEINYDFGPFVLTSITAYRSWNATEIREGDWLDRAAAYVGNEYAQLHDNGPQEGTTLSQEIRIGSPSGENLEYTLGAFYFRSETDRVFRRDVTVCSASTLAVDATGQRPCTQAASTFVSGFSIGTFGADATNLAIFGQASYDLTKRVTLIGGLRYTNDELSYYHVRIPNAAPIGLPGIRNDLSGFTGSTTTDNVSGKFGVQFQASDEAMFYATYSTGYKGPAYNVFFNMARNLTSSPPVDQTNIIESETAVSLEAGAKLNILENRFIVNLAVFSAKYENFQANNFDILNGVTISRLTNAGNIDTSGIELDGRLRVTSAFTLTGSAAYTNATIDCFNVVVAGVLTCSSARAGERLSFAPEFKSSVNADYRFTPDAGPFDVRLNASYSFTSAQYTDLGQNPLLLMPEYGIIDASVTLLDKNGRYSLAFVGKNLTDESYASLITTGGRGGALRYLIPREADTYYGITLKAKFGG
jgi:iron complex outermembrane recepter protein